MSNNKLDMTVIDLYIISQKKILFFSLRKLIFFKNFCKDNLQYESKFFVYKSEAGLCLSNFLNFLQSFSLVSLLTLSLPKKECTRHVMNRAVHLPFVYTIQYTGKAKKRDRPINGPTKRNNVYRVYSQDIECNRPMHRARRFQRPD